MITLSLRRRKEQPLLDFRGLIMRKNINNGLFGMALIAWASVVLAQGNSGELLWSDEFETGAQPNNAVWSYDIGTGVNGWCNFELQQYTNREDNARIENGNLVIAARETIVGGNRTGFTSARIKTQDKVMVRYGYIEARIKVPDLANGLWPAFWTLGNNFAEVGWPASGELDIMEMGWRDAVSDGYVNYWVSSTAHWENAGQHALYGRTYARSLIESEPLVDEYQVFAMDWTPTSIKTYLNDKEIWAMDISQSSCTDCEEFHRPHFMILNMAVGGTYPNIRTQGAVTATFPAEMMVDYVRIYDNGFTELSGSGATESTPNIGPAHSGSWYQATQDGHGFALEFGQTPDGSPLAVAYWYIYDDTGMPIFLVGSGVPEANRVTINFVSPVGMVFGDFAPETVVRESGGVGVFEFSNNSEGTFSYTPSEFTQDNWGHTAITDLPIQKLFGVPARDTFE
jgi:beta-glucanase (GH16 family)